MRHVDATSPAWSDAWSQAPSGSRRCALSWLLHPASVIALVVLLLNDDVLKAATPGVVTGKLSDVAGLVLAPPVLATLVALALPQVRAKTLALSVILGLGVAFAGAKATAVGAATASTISSHAWASSSVLRDPTDLIALPALGIAWWAFHRSGQASWPAVASATALASVMLPVAALGLLASSAGSYPSATGIIVRPGEVVVITGASATEYGRQSDAVAAIASTDGRVWRDLTAAELAARSPRPATGTGRSPWSCVPSDPEHCYRPVLHRLAVEQSSDGGRTWRMAWSVSPGRQRFLTRGYPEAYGGVSDVASRAVGILPVGAGYLVVVADGRDGVLVRHPDGRWQRQGFPNSGSSDVVSGRSSVPLVQTGERIGPEYISSTLAASLGLLLGGLGARRRRKGTWLQVSVSTLVLVTGIGFVAAFGGISAWTWTTAIAVLLALALVAWAFMVVTLGAVSAWRAALLVILAGATVAAMMAPMIGWSAGAIDSYDTAVRTMPISAAAGIAIMAVVGLVLGRLPE